MGNCYKVFHNGRLLAIVKDETKAIWLIDLFKLVEKLHGEFTYERAYIEGVDFGLY